MLGGTSASAASTPEVIRAFSRALSQGETVDVEFRKALKEAGLGLLETVNGKPRHVYKQQISCSGQKAKFGLLSLWATINVAQRIEGYELPRFVIDALKLDPAKNNERAIECVAGIYDHICNLDICKLALDAHKDAVELQQPDSDTDWESDAPFEPSPSRGISKGGTRARAKKKCFPVLETLLTDILTGLGLSHSKVEQRYEGRERVVTLDRRVEILRDKLIGKTSSCSQYVRTINLYLLWANSNWPDLWEVEGLIRVTPDMALQFLEDLKNGLLELRGDEPPFADVVNGRIKYTVVPREGEDHIFAASNAKMKLSALSFLQKQQCALLNEEACKLRSHPIVKAWEDNIIRNDIHNKRKRNINRQQCVICVDNPLDIKERHSVYWLLADSFDSWRNRFFTLAQCFSVSRTNDLLFWTFGDVTSFVYSSRLPTTGRQDIACLYILQNQGKSVKAGGIASVKLLVRHQSLLHCPISAFGMFLFRRLVMIGEAEPAIGFARSLFPTSNNLKKAVGENALYEQRRQMMIATGTVTMGCVNHQDRHFGTLIARIYNVTIEELKILGMWNSSVLELFYAKYPLADTVSRMAGFSSATTYLVERDIPDFEHFRCIKGGAELFDMFFPGIYNPAIEEAARKKATEGNDSDQASGNAHVNFLKAMKVLVIRFWKDLPAYYKLYPELEIFKCHALKSRWNIFLEWVRYTEKAIAMHKAREIQGPQGSSMPSRGLDAEFRRMIAANEVQTMKQAATNAKLEAKLDRVLHLLERGDKKPKIRSEESDDDDLNKDDAFVLRSMRKMNRETRHADASLWCVVDMSLDDLWSEWKDGVVSEGYTFPPLETMLLEKKVRIEKCLKTTIERRARICRFIEDMRMKSKAKDGLAHAMAMTKKLMTGKLAKNGEACSLYKLSEYIRAL